MFEREENKLAIELSPNQWGMSWVVFAYCGFIIIQILPSLLLSAIYIFSHPSAGFSSLSFKNYQFPVSLLGVSAIISQVMLILWVVLLVKFFHGFNLWTVIPFKGKRPMKWSAAAGAGFLLFAINVTIMVLVPPSNMDAPLTKMTSSTEGLLYFGFLALFLAPVGEELFFRGYIYSAVEGKWGAIPAVVISSILFAVPHSFQLGDYWQGVLLIGILGLLTGGLRWQTGGLKAGIICHFFYNFSLLSLETLSRLFTHSG